MQVQDKLRALDAVLGDRELTLTLVQAERGNPEIGATDYFTSMRMAIDSLYTKMGALVPLPTVAVPTQ